MFIRDFLRKGNTLFWNTQKFIQKKKNRFHVNVSPPLRFQRQYDFPQNLMTFHKILGLVMFLVFLEKSYVLGKGNLLFCCTCIWENYFGYFYLMFQFQGRQSENKNTDHWVKETCATMSVQVTYETDHISLLCDSTVSNVLNFCFFMYLIVI